MIASPLVVVQNRFACVGCSQLMVELLSKPANTVRIRLSLSRVDYRMVSEDLAWKANGSHDFCLSCAFSALMYSSFATQVFPACNLVGKRLDKRRERQLAAEKTRATKEALFQSVSGTNNDPKHRRLSTASQVKAPALSKSHLAPVTCRILLALWAIGALPGTRRWRECASLGVIHGLTSPVTPSGTDSRGQGSQRDAAIRPIGTT